MLLQYNWKLWYYGINKTICCYSITENHMRLLYNWKQCYYVIINNYILLWYNCKTCDNCIIKPYCVTIKTYFIMDEWKPYLTYIIENCWYSITKNYILLQLKTIFYYNAKKKYMILQNK